MPKALMLLRPFCVMCLTDMHACTHKLCTLFSLPHTRTRITSTYRSTIDLHHAPQAHAPT